MYNLSLGLSLYYQARHTVATAKIMHILKLQIQNSGDNQTWWNINDFLIILFSKFDRFNNFIVIYYFIAERIVCWHVVQVFLNHVIISAKNKIIIINLIILKPETLKVAKPGSWQLHLFTFCFWQLTLRNTKGAFAFRSVLLWEVKCSFSIKGNIPKTIKSPSLLNTKTSSPKGCYGATYSLIQQFHQFFVVFYYSH